MRMGAGMARIVKNLSLDPQAVERGERYSRRHGTSISQLVSDFLTGLPDDAEGKQLAPVVKRLLGVAKGGPGRGAYHGYLEKKYRK